jgi:hypothetical protein
MTMLWKDMHPVAVNTLPADMRTPDTMPKIRPIELGLLACEISFSAASGIPLPRQDPATFDRKDVVRRAVRVGLFDSVARTYIHNTAQVFAGWDQGKEDVWSFPSGGIGPIMFRTTHTDGLD